jgi:hypothetical protein
LWPASHTFYVTQNFEIVMIPYSRGFKKLDTGSGRVVGVVVGALVSRRRVCGSAQKHYGHDGGGVGPTARIRGHVACSKVMQYVEILPCLVFVTLGTAQHNHLLDRGLSIVCVTRVSAPLPAHPPRDNTVHCCGTFFLRLVLVVVTSYVTCASCRGPTRTRIFAM